MTKLHPLSTESRYSLDMACRLLYKHQPHSVRIYSDDVEMVQAVARRLGWLEGSLIVNNTALAEALSGLVGIRPLVGGSDADAALVPFCDAADFTPPTEPYLVVVSFNAFSYKSILYPGSVRGTIFQLMRRLTPKYALDLPVGLYAPQFLFPWLVSLLAGARFPALHFRFGQMAMDNMFVFGWMWRMSYIVVIAGHQRR